VFTCQDDITFFQYRRNDRGNLGPDNDNDGVVESTDNNGVLDSNEMPQAPIIQGDYTYLVMVTPAETENPFPSQPPYVKAVALDQRRLFTVQVVVFHKRVMGIDTTLSPIPTPAERQVYARIDSANSATLFAQPEYLRGLAPNQWILLSARLNGRPPDDPALAPPNSPPIHRWVRIVSIGKIEGASDVRINFAGPDWPTDNTTTTPGEAVATIVSNIVGVHERTVQLDARSLTAP
jgi:hypothetical protein